MKAITWMLVPILFLLQYEIWLAPGGVSSLLRLRHQLTQEISINQEWQRRNQILIADIDDLKHGNQAIEDHARSDLGMIKPGETLYQLP
ncbi:MAG: septum formation initiator family protein [Proteobacteria bacterium]|nr:septum formation initiator family protein [Pseudomonadota bacterium]